MSTDFSVLYLYIYRCFYVYLIHNYLYKNTSNNIYKTTLHIYVAFSLG